MKEEFRDETGNQFVLWGYLIVVSRRLKLFAEQRLIYLPRYSIPQPQPDIEIDEQYLVS